MNCRNGIILADRLAAGGSKVFGWDIEWEMDWSVSRCSQFSKLKQEILVLFRLSYGAEEMLRRLSGVTGQAGGQTVILCHDVALRPGAQDSRHLTDFLWRATQAGYQFRTLSTFSKQ